MVCFRGRQIVHRAENIGLLFLSPYAVAEIDSDGCLLRKEDEEEGIVIDFFPESELIVLFNNLNKGMKEKELQDAFLKVMDEETAEEWIAILLVGGFIG